MPRTPGGGLVVAPGKKTAETIQSEARREIASLLEAVFGGLRKSGHFDLEAVEMATRATAHQLGAKMLERLLNTPAEFGRDIPCPCGSRARFHQLRPKQLVTVLGPVTLERPCYLCAACHKGLSVPATSNWTPQALSTRPACAA